MSNLLKVREEEFAAALRKHDGDFARWAAGYGAIRHTAHTQVRVHAMQQTLALRGVSGDGVAFYDLMHALDRLVSAGMWLVAHAAYARNVYRDGRDLQSEDFKASPQGHMGGSLNMVPAYAGYLAANVAAGITRAWLMGQGHCVSAVDCLNVLTGNTTPAHASRYAVSDEGFTRLARDFYSYAVAPDGSPESPLGSHVNHHTAGGLIEGGFLGFAELLYPHIPLPGERLVVFLSDGAFEEQRGSDWAPRWWRLEDSGFVMPIMISNARRIDQRTITSQEGGPQWFVEHLKLNNFDPIVFDGCDPAAFVWAIFEMEERLAAFAEARRKGAQSYPAPLPYGVAVAPKGAGFYGEGTNDAHGLPLGANPYVNAEARAHFNQSARTLWVPPGELGDAIALFSRHRSRVRERDHPIAHRDVSLTTLPEPSWESTDLQRRGRIGAPQRCAMAAIDDGFLGILRANPHLRARMGNPDESRSNHMYHTLDALKHRVTEPEHGNDEDILGQVITALNEEAVVCAALGNKGGINIVVTYEAFGVKMQSALRQEIIFADHSNAAGRAPRWLSVPLILTSHTWENGKNERSHQDPSMCEAMMGEPADVSRVMFPADYNTAAAVIHAVYQTYGQIWTIVAPKSDVPALFTRGEAQQLVAEGAIALDWAGYREEDARLVLSAIGSYQLVEVLKASERLTEREIAHRVVYILEPGRLRRPRTARESEHVAQPARRQRLFGSAQAYLYVSHTRPEPILGILQPAHERTARAALGYIGHGGTYSTAGLLFANRCSWAHILREAAALLQLDANTVLSEAEFAPIRGVGDPTIVMLKS